MVGTKLLTFPYKTLNYWLQLFLGIKIPPKVPPILKVTTKGLTMTPSNMKTTKHNELPESGKIIASTDEHFYILYPDGRIDVHPH
jgi:hypothetical protein